MYEDEVYDINEPKRRRNFTIVFIGVPILLWLIVLISEPMPPFMALAALLQVFGIYCSYLIIPWLLALMFITIYTMGKDRGLLQKVSIALICLSSILTLSFFIGYKNIGGFLDRNHFKTQMYANIFPRESTSKNYRVLVDVEVQNNRTVIGSELDRNIAVTRIHWPNGGYSTIDQDSYDSGILSPMDPTFMRDNEDREWTLELINGSVSK